MDFFLSWPGIVLMSVILLGVLLVFSIHRENKRLQRLRQEAALELQHRLPYLKEDEMRWIVENVHKCTHLVIFPGGSTQQPFRSKNGFNCDFIVLTFGNIQCYEIYDFLREMLKAQRIPGGLKEEAEKILDIKV